ncbi:1353_t:CDS:10 [Ambispora leptoticha]|uniref:1353_t:CDS:1 n=1 Tax=Ambispora leptoticha TaxID=144679 RepID=A0A9N9BV67_9GLOM|nr:1353_t:CDS:10 [Ambispora leptoticha]
MQGLHGNSRCFGFIGYRTPKEAEFALQYFNNTFIDTSRIIVEFAKPVNDPSLPRPWSAHSIGSSVYQQRHNSSNDNNNIGNNKDKNSRDSDDAENTDNDNKNHNEKKLREYLKVMKPRSKSKTWANDDADLVNNDIQGENAKKERKKKKKESDDELYEDLKKNGKIADSNNNTLKQEQKKKKNGSELFNTKKSDKGTEKSEELSVSDMDSKRSNLESDDDNESEDSSKDFTEDYKESQTFKSTIDRNNNELNNKNLLPENRQPPSQPPHEETIAETGRLFVRNLPYICTEEDLRKEFHQFGPLAEVHMPIDRETKKPMGFAYVLYLIPEHAVKAFIELDNKFFMGRLLHILPSWEKKSNSFTRKDQRDANKKLSLKKEKENKLKSLAANDFNWNTLYMNSDAIMDSIATRLNIKKSEILDPESENMSARMALAETHVIQETKLFLEKQGIRLDAFSSKERSDTVILVKNISFDTTKEELSQLFGWYGNIVKFILPPSKTIAIIEFLNPTEARAAFFGLAYKKFKGVPLYLEKAPANIFIKDPINPLSSADLVEPSTTKDTKDETIMDLDEPEVATLFVKNLSFNTTEEKLCAVFKEKTTGVRSTRIKMKNDPKNPGKKLSMGFGFIEFDSVKNAKNALKLMQNHTLDGHALQLKFSNYVAASVPKKRKEKEDPGGKEVSTKIIVKNLAFESTKKDLRELFSAYGQIKSLRVPKKFDGTSRGFAFIEFLTKRDAQNVMENLSATHLLGRHLVLEYAAMARDDDVEELRAKVGRDFEMRQRGSDGRATKRKKVDLEEWANVKSDSE